MKFTQYHRARAKDPKYSRQFKKPRMPTYWLPISKFVTAVATSMDILPQQRKLVNGKPLELLRLKIKHPGDIDARRVGYKYEDFLNTWAGWLHKVTIKPPFKADFRTQLETATERALNRLGFDYTKNQIATLVDTAKDTGHLLTFEIDLSILNLQKSCENTVRKLYETSSYCEVLATLGDTNEAQARQ